MPGGYGDGYYGAGAGTYAKLDGTALGPFPGAANPTAVRGGWLNYFGKAGSPFFPRRFQAAPATLTELGAAAFISGAGIGTHVFDWDATYANPYGLWNPATHAITIDQPGAWRYEWWNFFYTATVAGGQTVHPFLTINGVRAVDLGTAVSPPHSGGFADVAFTDDRGPVTAPPLDGAAIAQSFYRGVLHDLQPGDVLGFLFDYNALGDSIQPQGRYLSLLPVTL